MSVDSAEFDGPAALAIEGGQLSVFGLWPVRDLKAEGRKFMGCDVAKNRQGRTGEHGLDFFVGTQRWAESTADITPRPAKDNL